MFEADEGARLLDIWAGVAAEQSRESMWKEPGAKYVWLAQGTARRSVRRGVSERESGRIRNDKGNVVLDHVETYRLLQGFDFYSGWGYCGVSWSDLG